MSFDIADVQSLPVPEKCTVTRVFQGGGRAWEITISANGPIDPEQMYRLSRIINKGQVTKSRNVVLPGIEPFTLTEPAYIRNLEFLRAVSVSPAWNTPDGWDCWAVFGQRLGATVMSEVIAWALQANFIVESEAKAAVDEAGEATAQAP